MKQDYSINIERAVINSIIFDPDLIEDISLKLRSNDFYFEPHQNIYQIILELYNKELPIDEEFIKKNLNNFNVQELHLYEILASNPTPNSFAYVDDILENSKKRQIQSISNNIRKELNEDMSSSDLLDSITKQIEFVENDTYYEYETSSKIVETVKHKMQESYENNGKFLGQKSGLIELDKIIHGFEDGDLIVIAARPSMGKTSLISAITTQILSDNSGALIESLEMPSWKIMQRLISSYSNELLSDIKQGVVKNKNNFNNAINFFACEKLIINDKTYPTINQLQNRIKKILRKNKEIKNVFIDHTGKIALEGKTREDIEIGHITNMLKKIARDFNIRVFLLQQLNRSVESRDNKRPMLSDLKNSGNIEEDADIVLGLYRDSYYKTKETTNTEKNIEQAEIIILKNRDGATGIAKVAFEGRCSKFINSKIITHVPEIITFKDA